MRQIVWTLVIAGLVALPGIPATAQAQPEPDTLEVEVPGIEIRALRGRDRIGDIPAATFVLSRETLRRSAMTRIATLLQTLPGLYGFRQTSSGEPTVVDPRGFTASGESSYLKLLIDGQDVRDVENGNVDWDWVVPDDVERIEVVQGPGAWAYGDGSEGGIVNVVRSDPSRPFASDCFLRGGSFGMRGGSLALSGTGGSMAGSLRGGLREVDGWRDRSRERVTNGGASISLLGSSVVLRAEASLLDTERDNPGTLTGEQLAVDQEQAESVHDFDRAQRWIGSLRAMSVAGRVSTWSIGPYARFEEGDQVRTLFFQPLFHHTRARTAGAEANWSRPWGTWPFVVQAGLQVERSRLDSEYDDYTPGVGLGARAAEGSSRRHLLAPSAGLKVDLGGGTVARISARLDLARVRGRDDFAGTTTSWRQMSSLSPMLGVSHRIGERASVYASAGTAFRIPTLFQLFDRRPIAVAPGVNISISNPQLDPQRSRSVEAGARYDGLAGGSLVVAAYSTWVRNEIDFDLATLSYANINRSWHRGVEGQWTASVLEVFSIRLSGSWTPTTFRGGDRDGKQINGVPTSFGHASVAWQPFPVGSLEIGTHVVGEQFLDKEEQHPLAAYTTWEAGVSARVGRIRGTVRALNLFDRRYSDSGFIGAFGEERFSPAAPRSFTAALSFD